MVVVLPVVVLYCVVNCCHSTQKKIWFMLDIDHTLNVRSVYCSGTVLGYPNSIFDDNSYKSSINPQHLLPRACKFQPKTGRERFFELIL